MNVLFGAQTYAIVIPNSAVLYQKVGVSSMAHICIYDRIWKQPVKTVIHSWVMQTQIYNISKCTHSSGSKHADLYTFEGDVSIISSIIKSIMGLHHSPTW